MVFTFSLMANVLASGAGHEHKGSTGSGLAMLHHSFSEVSCRRTLLLAVR
jgi:hypothetical protein